MFSVRGYQTTTRLHASERSLVLRARREADGRAVILKVLEDQHPPPEVIARFQREFRLLADLDLPGVVQAYELLHASSHWIIVQEDFGGESLRRLGLAGQLGLDEFLSIATSIAEHVCAIHQRRVIHKDLNPDNIVLERDSGVVKLIDFGIASRLSRETVAFDHPSLIEGTPAYLSPEQTGRINRPVDHRTDLYSLGCTFYELLTGRPPFEGADLLELLHCHLARPPEPLAARRPELPAVLGAIVDKLLAKNASDRYQSAQGLLADLSRCHEQAAQHRVVESFEPGRHDVSEWLAPPTRLHGRAAERAELLAAFERVRTGSSELLLVSGDPGVGKSALVKELYRPVTESRGVFVSGKSDQFQRDTPYQPILGALDGLVAQALIEPPAQVAQRAEVLREAAGAMLPAIVDLLPRLELLYERLPPLPALPSAEFNHRFPRALAGCVRAFAGPEHPLVLFIDDLQWADGASLDLLERLMTGEPTPYLLIIGAYRPREVPAGHPLRTKLADVRASGASIHALELELLDLHATAALVADVLHCTLEEVREPAEIVHRKTGGNPFFVQIFLDTLSADGVLGFDHEAGAWRWALERLRLLELSDNVVDLVLDNLLRLPEPTRELLAQAACIGSHFELGLLARVAQRPRGEVAESLMPALSGNYLIPTSGDYRLLEARLGELDEQLDVSYKFAHDRIQQAAYGLVPADAHAALHLRIGRGMRALDHGKPSEPRLLAAVTQLDQARALVDDPDERLEIARLNLAAGSKAKAAVAHGAARTFFEHGLAFLDERDPARAFAVDYRLALALTEGAAEAAYLEAEFEAMEHHVEAVLRHARHHRDRVEATLVRFNALAARNELLASVEVGRELLESLGVELPADPTEAQVEALFEAVERELGGRAPRDLVELPALEADEPRAAMRVLERIYNPAFVAHPRLPPLIAAHMVLLTLRHGASEESVHGFIYYGIALSGHGRVELGYEFGGLAEALVERHQSKSALPVLAVMGWAYVFHWKRALRGSIQKMRDGYRAGLESGFIEQGVNCLQCSSAMGYLTGCDLAVVDEEYAESREVLERYRQGPYLTWLRQFHQAVRSFRGLSDDPAVLRGDTYDELRERSEHEEAGDLSAIYLIDFNAMILRYHFHDYAEALRRARAIEVGNQPGSIYLILGVFYRGLAALAAYDEAPPEERPALLEEVQPLLLDLERWAELCPANYGHKYHLVAAEHCRVSGRLEAARTHYDLAVDLAREHEYTQEEGLALERAGMFYLAEGNQRLAGYYMRDAYYAFERWGARAKLELLRERFGYLLDRGPSARSRITTSITGTAEVGELDLGTVLEATRAIARETDVDAVLRTIMRVSLENAGAERGFLILVREDRLLVGIRGEAEPRMHFEALSVALGDQEDLARSIVQYVAQAAEPVLLDHAAEVGMFTQDPHVRAHACRSILCLPIHNQGRLVAICYLENNQTVGVFDRDRLDVLTLLMGQAAVSVENALLRGREDMRAEPYRIGGSLPPNSPIYVRRRADELLAEYIRHGEFCYVFNARQMGKSSLRIRAADRLSRAGVACASLDLSAIGTSGLTARQWYAGVARALVSGLGLRSGLDLRRWWRDHDELPPVQQLDLLVDEEILPRIDGPVAVLVDEVDSVLGLDFPVDDFFALIRAFYNRRAEDPRYEGLSVILLGVATPADLIRDKRRTPFNIGRAVPLSGFRFDEARILAPGLAHVGDAERLLRALLDWTYGQPFLTQKLCQLVAEDESRPPAGKEREWVANLVRSRVIEGWRHHDEPEHFRTIEARLLGVPQDIPALMTRYRQLLDHGEVEADDSVLETTLVLSGLVVRAFDKLRVGNPIYAAIFDHRWIEGALASAGAAS